MTIDYTIHENIGPNDPLWADFRRLVDEENWKADDHSFMVLTRVMSSTRSIFAKNSDNEFVSCVVWHEYDEQAIISVYLTAKMYRGQGIGKRLWKMAFSRFPSGYNVGLRAVHNMIEWYKERGLSYEGPFVDSYVVSANNTESFKKYENTNATVKNVVDLTENELGSFHEFDKFITGRDRSEFLRRFHTLPFTSGSCLLNENGEVIAYAAISATSKDERNMYKLAPIYASSIQDALTVIRPLIDFAKNRAPSAQLVVNIHSGTRGSDELRPIVDAVKSAKRQNAAGTLYSMPLKIPIDWNRIYIAHGNYAHFDT